MAKPNPLKSFASQVAESLDRPPERPSGSPAAPEPQKPAADELPALMVKAPRPTGSKTSREGKKFLGLYVEPRRHEEIRQAALDEGIQVQELLQQALDEWMARYGQEAVEAVATRHARRSKRAS